MYSLNNYFYFHTIKMAALSRHFQLCTRFRQLLPVGSTTFTKLQARCMKTGKRKRLNTTKAFTCCQLAQFMLVWNLSLFPHPIHDWRIPSPRHWPQLQVIKFYDGWIHDYFWLEHDCDRIMVNLIRKGHKLFQDIF